MLHIFEINAYVFYAVYSLIQQILNMAPGMSSMVNKCSAFHGKKCVNFNHEVSSQINEIIYRHFTYFNLIYAIAVSVVKLFV